jgi:hypothetical protein
VNLQNARCNNKNTENKLPDFQVCEMQITTLVLPHQSESKKQTKLIQVEAHGNKF